MTFASRSKDDGPSRETRLFLEFAVVPSQDAVEACQADQLLCRGEKKAMRSRKIAVMDLQDWPRQTIVLLILLDDGVYIWLVPKC